MEFLKIEDEIKRINIFLENKKEVKANDYIFKNIEDLVSICSKIKSLSDRYETMISENFKNIDNYYFCEIDKLTTTGLDCLYNIFIYQLNKDRFILKVKRFNMLFPLFTYILQHRKAYYELDERIKQEKEKNFNFIPKFITSRNDTEIVNFDKVYMNMYNFIMISNLINIFDYEMYERFKKDERLNSLFTNYVSLNNNKMYKRFRFSLFNMQRKTINNIFKYARRNRNKNIPYI